MSFRRFGGIDRTAKNNVVKTQYSNNVYQTISHQLGMENSNIISKSNIDLSCNSLLNTGEIQFCDGTIQNTAAIFYGILAPPAVSINSETGSTEILFTWTIPTYENTGSPFKYILLDIYAYLYTTLNTNPTEYKSYNVLPTDASDYISTVDAIVVSNVSYSGGNGYISNYTCIDGVTRSVFYYYNSDFLEMEANNYNELTLWYTNNYPYPNIGYTYYDSFLTSGPPGMVFFNTATQYDQSANNIILNCFVYYTDILNANSTASLTNYKIPAYGYDSSGSLIRYPSALQDSGPPSDIITAATSGEGTGSTNSTAFLLGIDSSYNAPIYPSSKYTFNVSAKNNLNSNYGAIGQYTYTTEKLPEPASTIPSPLFDSSSYKYTDSSNNIYLVSSEAQVSYDVINITNVSNSSGFISNPFITPVQTINNLGLTYPISDQSANFLTITADVSSNSCVQYIHGFDTSLNLTSTDPYAYNYLSTTTNGITLNTNVYDYYETDFSCNQGFYLMADISMDISSTILSATNSLYTATLTTAQINQFTTDPSAATWDASYSFYCDNINSPPSYNSLGGFSVNNVNNYYSILVSGIYVMYQDPTFTIDLSLNNMGDYFYRSPLVTYTFSGGATTTATESDLSNVTNLSNPLPNTINITNIDVSGTLLTSLWYNNITLSSITYQNIYSSITTPINSIISTIVDLQSYNLAYITIPSSIPSVGVDTSNNGYRVWSAPSLTSGYNPIDIVPSLYIYDGSYNPYGQVTSPTGYFDVSYNNSWDISTSQSVYYPYGVYQELLIANGYFTTNNNYYLDYDASYSDAATNTVNYLPANMNTGSYKYATFAWQLYQSSSNYIYMSVTINFKNTMYFSNNYAYFDSGHTYPLELYYRVEDVTNNNITNFGQIGTSGQYYSNTAWISMNSQVNTDIIGQSYQFSGGTNAYVNNNYVYWATPILSYTGQQPSGPITFKTYFPSINVLSGSTKYLYVRIGMPNGTTGYDGFSTVTAQLYTS